MTVRVIKKELTVPKVTQYYYEVKPKNKVEVMSRLLDMYAPKLPSCSAIQSVRWMTWCRNSREGDILQRAFMEI